MRSVERVDNLWSALRHPWIAGYLLFYLAGLIVLLLLEQFAALREILPATLSGCIGLALAGRVTHEEGSRPGPAPRAALGVGLALALTVLAILRPKFFWPAGAEVSIQRLLLQLFWLVLLPAAALRLSGVPWSYLGLPSLLRWWGRWHKLGLSLAALLFLPALLRPSVWQAFLQGPPLRLLLALPIAYTYVWLARALPQEFVYRQVLQPRLQALLQRPLSGIIAQAVIFGLAGAGHYLQQGRPWPLALLGGFLQSSILGLFYGLLRDRSGSLGLPVYLHAWVEMWSVLPYALAWMGG